MDDSQAIGQQDLPDGHPYKMDNTLKLQQQDLTSWMYVSVDTNGKVLVNTIQKVMFTHRASKYVLIEPVKNESKFYAISARFRSDLYP